MFFKKASAIFYTEKIPKNGVFNFLKGSLFSFCVRTLLSYNNKRKHYIVPLENYTSREEELPTLMA